MIGVYFLFDGKRVAYIGATSNWPTRIAAHKFNFDSARLLECRKKDLAKLEKRLIAIFKPINNHMHTVRSGKKMNLSWVRKNFTEIDKIVRKLNSNAKKGNHHINLALPLLERMKRELKYSPRTNACDIYHSLETAYQFVKDEIESKD